MRYEFYAVPDPSNEVCSEVAALAPTNPFYAHAYLQARRSLGFRPWMLALRWGEPMVAACTAFVKAGYLNRSLEISSLPVLQDPDTFWEGLLGFCRRLRVSYLEVNSFASSVAAIPPLSGEVGRRGRAEYVLDLQKPGLWDRLSSNHARNIKRARGAGLQVRRARDPLACGDHAGLVEVSMGRRRGRGESAPGDIETRSFEALFRSGAGELFQAVSDGSVMSSVLVLRAERGAYYQSAGTTADGMACGASHFLLYETANTLRQELLEVFNLGGAGRDNPGLERFKVGFGATVVELEAAEFFLGGRVRGNLGRIHRSVLRGLSGLTSHSLPTK